MKSHFPFKFKIALWLAFFLFSLLCQGQNAEAQFGLFDTVWTTNTFLISGSGHTTISKNDSLLFLFKPGKYAVLDDTSEKYVLIRTLNLQDTVWYISNFPTQNEPLCFIENDSKILFDSRTWTVPRTDYVNSSIITRDAGTFQVVDSVAFDYWTYPPNTGNCYKWYTGISEVDTSVYYSGYCGATAIKGISYKVNYHTGQVKETSHILPYFAMTISEDGQYVAGVYYTGGTASNVPYNEVIEVRKISDYSLVFRESRYRQDYDPNFAPYQWVTKYKFRFSKDNKFLALNYGFDAIAVYNLVDKEKIYFENGDPTFSYCDFSSTNKLIFINNFNYTEKEQKISIFDCENEVFHELKFSDKTHSATGLLKELILDKYIIISPSYYFNSEKQWYSGLGDISLFRLNFDINSIQEPDNTIEGTLYPNPTNNIINLTFEITEAAQLNFSIYSETGQIIKVLLNEFTNPGTITKSFDVSDLPTGTHFLRITGKNFSQTYKVIINR